MGAQNFFLNRDEAAHVFCLVRLLSFMKESTEKQSKRLKRKIPEIGDCGGREFARTLHTEQWEFSHTLFVL
jgi:hypothetical protein